MTLSTVRLTWLTVLSAAALLFFSQVVTGQPHPDIPPEAISGNVKNLTDKELTTLLASVKNNFGEIRTLKTRLVQKKHLALFSVPVESKGVLLFKSPDQLRLEFFEPFQSLLMVSHKKLAKFEGFDGEWRKAPAGNTRIMEAVLGQIATWVKGEFNRDNLYRVSGRYRPAGDKKEVSIVLEPRDEQFKKFIRGFELGINTEMDQLNFIIIRESETDYTRIDFQDSRINTPLDDAFFDGDLRPIPRLPRW